MIIGYARVSTTDQNLDRQIDQLKDAGCERIYSEKRSGKNVERPELIRMFDAVRNGDVIVVADLTRLGRSLKDLLDLMAQIERLGAEVRSLKEPWLDTTSAQGRLLFAIFAGLSEFERDLIRQRTREGLESARARGRKGGRPIKDEKAVQLALTMYESRKYSVKDISAATGLSRSSLYNYLKPRHCKS